jgi:hypothetical protein
VTPQPLPRIGKPTTASVGITVYGVQSCDLPGCEQPRKLGANRQGRFCCESHKAEYWHMAAVIGDQQLRQIKTGEYAKQVWDRLKERAGKWVDRPRHSYRDVIRRLKPQAAKRGETLKTRQVRDGLGLKYQDMLIG